MDRLIVLQFLLIFLAVPLQLLIMTKWSNKNTEQATTINKYHLHLHRYF